MGTGKSDEGSPEMQAKIAKMQDELKEKRWKLHLVVGW